MPVPQVLFFILLSCLLPLTAETRQDCQTLRHHGKLAEARRCFTYLLASRDPYPRAEALWGLERYMDANDQFRLAVKENPKSAEYRVRWGRMFLERFQPADADKLFKEALQIDEKDANAYLGLALVAAQGYGPKAVEFAQKAIELDPKLVEAQELLAYLALEDNDIDKARKEAGKAIAISPEALDAMAVQATIDWLDDKPGTEWMDRILKVNPVYGEAYSIGGHFFVINRRYVDGIKLYRKALELNPRLWEARSELGVNLMRLGQEDEARTQLEQCYNNGYQSSETVNSLRLLDSYKRFNTYKTARTIIRLDKKEADLLLPYFQSELNRVIARYDKKYKFTLNQPVQLEVYPNHDDFAVRTAGMPGIGAILGVTFGAVVAMDSPSGRPPGQFHWASTMWHEMSHVYVLTMTNHRVPRWFTEGVAVYEETAAAPDWGDRLDPESINAIKEKKLLPVAQLDRGFVRPTYPAQVIVSYFQAGKICSYISEKWGYDKLLQMMHAFGALKTTPQVIQESLGMSPEQFDKEFLAWLEAQTKVTVDHFAEWKKSVKEMISALDSHNYDEAIKEGTGFGISIRTLSNRTAYTRCSARLTWQRSTKPRRGNSSRNTSSVGGRNSTTIKKLATLEEEAGDKQKAAAALDRLNYIYPIDEELHRRLGDLWLAQNNVTGAIREYEALVASKPIDPATSHYDLAKALKLGHRDDDAREQVLLALEAAPGFKPAQQLLLELSK